MAGAIEDRVAVKIEEELLKIWKVTAAVDSSEIRRAPVEVGSVSHYLQGFILCRWLAGFLNHQQYYYL